MSINIKDTISIVILDLSIGCELKSSIISCEIPSNTSVSINNPQIKVSI